MKRSITLSGHRTSISLETPFWDALKQIADLENISPTELIVGVDAKRQPEDNLSSAIRIYILRYFQNEFSQT